MPEFMSDGILYCVILASAYYAFRTVPDHLNHIRNLAAYPEPVGSGPRKQLRKDAEKAINIDTLRVLSDGHSYDIRASTIKIVASRTVKSRTKKLLLKDLASKDETRRYNAICGIWMLVYNPALRDKHIRQEFLDHKSFYALITALKNVLSHHQPGQPSRLLSPGNSLYPEPELPPSPVKVPIRPIHELCLMMMLKALLDEPRPYDKTSEHPDNITCALSAGLVTRWLKDYPFPCALPQNSHYNFKKSDVTSLLDSSAWACDDDLMADIVRKIRKTALGKDQLRDAGLIGSGWSELEDVRWKRVRSRLDTIDSENDVRMIDGEGTAGAATPPPIPIVGRWQDVDVEEPRVRLQELSPEEETLRRRRRQAVVVAEPGAPISQENILQRTDSGSAWRANTDDDILENAGTTPASSGSATPPIEMALSLATQEHFNFLVQPLLDDRTRVENFREGVITGDPSSDHVDVSARFIALLDQFRETRERVRMSIQDGPFTETERRFFAARVDNIVLDIVNDEDTQGTIHILQAAQSGTGRFDG